MASRARSERRFPQWDDLPSGGRRYYRFRKGKKRGYARYVKEADASENTMLIVQEIYDDQDRLIAVHEKYPTDNGHQQFEFDEDTGE